MPGSKLHRIPDLLDALVTTPNITEAAARCQMSRETVYSYLVRSRMGDPKLQDIEWYGVKAPFHVHALQNARALAATAIEQAALDRAMKGVMVDVFFQGQRQYESIEDPQLVEDARDLQVWEILHGDRPITDIYKKVPVKQWLKPSDQLVIKMLESWNKRYRPHQQVDVNFGGVLRLERPDEKQAMTMMPPNSVADTWRLAVPQSRVRNWTSGIEMASSSRSR